jgi:UDP-MurNAc hydroxylase
MPRGVYRRAIPTRPGSITLRLTEASSCGATNRSGIENPLAGPMKITFVNHASILLEAKAASIWTDPWTAGKILNDCVALYSPSARVPLERVQFIWISHQHPDHLHFPTLKAIPETERRRMTILYQRHSSPRVVESLQKLGFGNVIELPQYRWKTLRPGFEVLCGCVGATESFLAVKSEGECVLNMNDCVCTDSTLRYIRRLVGQPTLFFTQFSTARWVGNRADETGAVAQKMRELKYGILTLKPEATVPFASFAYRCNYENEWMNQFGMTPARLMEMNLPGVNFMYPGDVWDSAERKFRTPEAVAKYEADFKNLAIDPVPPSVDQDKIRLAVNKLLAALRKRFSKIVLSRIEPFQIYTHDTNMVFTINPAAGTCQSREATREGAANARYAMCSQVAWYTFTCPWGWSVLEGNATFIDREFKVKGENKLWKRCVTKLESDDLWFDSSARFVRTLGFLWGKKSEILCRFLGKPVSEEAIRKAAPSAGAENWQTRPATEA